MRDRSPSMHTNSAEEGKREMFNGKRKWDCKNRYTAQIAKQCCGEWFFIFRHPGSY